jgi:hypothetical protein
MSRLVKLLVLLFFLLVADSVFPYSSIYNGSLCPESFGAKGDGSHDDTKAIQTLLDSLDKIGGGTMYLGSGTYMVTSIHLGKKTSAVGCGNGATLIKQIKGIKAACVIVQPMSAALNISNLTIVGNNDNIGLMIENTSDGQENHLYLYNKGIKDGVPQPYKWMTIDNICIYHFETGLNIENKGYNINICNSTISHNGVGVIMKCTDSSIYNCYITNNRKEGLVLSGSNNKVSNIKSIWNGLGDGKNCAAIVIGGSRCQLVNCETQDNYCSGFLINGQYNLLSNCISNTDGYSNKSRQYDSEIEACGFKIKGLYNSFSNCAVTNYTDKYGAIFHSPIIIDSTISYHYPDIYNDIRVLIAKDRPLFHEPFRNVQTLASKNKVSDGLIKKVDCRINSLNMLIDFKSSGENGDILSISGDKKMTVTLENQSVNLIWQGVTKAKLLLDKDAVLDKDESRLIISCFQKGQVLTVSMLMYEKTHKRGWIKKEVRQETDIPATMITGAIVRIGDQTVKVRRIALSNTPMPESVFLPYSNLNRIYDSSLVYVDSDSAM